MILDRGIELVPILTADSKGFTVDLKDEGRVFVYGTQVADFRTVDYEAISMLNVSATQELLKLITNLQKENERYKAKLNTLSGDVETLKAAVGSSQSAIGK